MSLKETLRGTGTAMVTPFLDDRSIDYDALGKLINFNIENGVEYIVSMGTTGETPTLNSAEKKELLKQTLEFVNARVPVVLGMGGNDTMKLKAEIEEVDLTGITAILSASPYYNKPSQEGLYQHYKVVAASSAVPVILYNVPGRTGKNMEPETTIRLANEVGNIKGIKEASNNIPQCMQILRDAPKDFLVLSGDDDLVLPEIAAGIDGVISVAANCFPASFSEMVRAGLSGNFGIANALNYKMMDAYKLLFVENNPAGAKAFLFEMGLIKNNLRLPLVPLSQSVHEAVKQYLS